MRYMRTILVFVLSAQATVRAQQLNPDNISISAQPVLDAAGPKQRVAIKAVYLIVCEKDNSAGTGFLIKAGVIVTNEHVVGNCTKDDLVAISPTNGKIHFTRLATDKDRDLALLKPSEDLNGGLELARTNDPAPGTEVSTWGYPFIYNGTYPLLSIGYVAGYRQEEKPKRNVHHLIINGAFNHGNSGGPLLVTRDNRVIGVVVATYHFFPKYVQETIDVLKAPSGGVSTGRFSALDASGHSQPLVDQQVIGIILEEFYQITQVMIGEAISVSELRNLIIEKQNELGLQQPQAAKDEKGAARRAKP
jgi:hypothetical protein